ncbi:hypothetical protein V1506DRAFT_507178 [Lipomyces tetrasporus]
MANHQQGRNRFYFTRPVLLWQSKGPWQMLRDSSDEKAFILTTGISPAIFIYILGSGFRHAWDTTPITREDVWSGWAAYRNESVLLPEDFEFGLRVW